VDADCLDIGLVVVNSSSSADLRIRNVGTANLVINEFLFEEADAVYFSGTGISFPYTILPNDTAWLPVTFLPDSVRPFEALLIVASNDPEQDSIQVRVFGEGVPIPLPDIDLAKDSLLFAETALTTIKTDSVRIFNTGIADLVITGFTISGLDSADFQLSMQPLPSIIARGDSASLLIDFIPQAVGERGAILEIFNNDPDENPATVYLRGDAVAIPVPDIVISSDTLNFGVIDIGDFSFQELLVQNFGTADLTVSSTEIHGLDSSVFTITFGDAPFTIEPGDSQRIDIRFLPFDLGERAAELNLITNDPDELSIRVALFGASLDTTQIDTLAPVCSTYTTFIEREQMQIAVVDTGSGMKSIEVLESENMDVILPMFMVGARDTLLLIATRISEQDIGQIRIAVTDRKNNVSFCEAVLDSITDIEPEPGLPDVFTLAQNFPNPFNPSTEIKFSIPVDGQQVRLEIYDVMGRRIRILVDDQLRRGFYSARWDGRDALGRRAASGVYVYRLASATQERVRKMLLVR
ncbi:MAG: choice-of-anchor D domain-containing protein, partial [Calditrichota bacterium]